MTRTVAREIAVRLCFGIDHSGSDIEASLDEFFDSEYYSTLAVEDKLFSQEPDKKQLEYIKTVVTGALQHKERLDELIEKYSKGWKISRISQIAVTILRVCMFEILYMEEIPDSAAINEAVELAKGYEEPETVSFINGILGSLMRDERGETEG